MCNLLKGLRIVAVSTAVVVMLLAAAPAQATFLVSADLAAGAGGSGGPVMSGVEATAAAAAVNFGEANVWNSLKINSDQQGVQNGASFTGLLDSTGTATGVSLTVTGSIFAWNSAAGLDALTGDYWHVKSGKTLESIDWQIGGLDASTDYHLWMYGARFTDALSPWQLQGHDALIDLNGDGSLGDETSALVQGIGQLFTVTSDASGTVLGRTKWHQWLNLEGHWSGFQISTPSVPEPSTFVLVGMGLVGMLAYAWRKRR